jgi:acetyl-CoA decarbonylase/synthase complex subunit gamma
LAAWTFLLPVVTSFAVMNYTGSTTYTSLSGVRREMQRAVPLQAIGCVIGISLWLIGRFA